MITDANSCVNTEEVVGFYKRKQESKKTRKHAFEQGSDQEKKKKTRSRPRKIRKKLS